MNWLGLRKYASLHDFTVLGHIEMAVSLKENLK